MNIQAILVATLLVGGVGLIIGIFLCFFKEKFSVEVDPRVEAIEGLLPGNNCGACGYPGCSGLADAIVKGDAPINQCAGCSQDTVDKIADVMGVKSEVKEKYVAYVRCGGTCEKASKKYEYTGIEDCIAVNSVPGAGEKACGHGCLGYGSCVKACKFDAIHIVDGVAKVDKEKCTGCGTCMATCPKGLIELIKYTDKHEVTCMSTEMGKVVNKTCKAGCIGCKICEKNCKFDAIHVIDNLAVIDHDKCKNCGVCAMKCPKKVIS